MSTVAAASIWYGYRVEEVEEDQVLVVRVTSPLFNQSKTYESLSACCLSGEPPGCVKAWVSCGSFHI